MLSHEARLGAWMVEDLDVRDHPKLSPFLLYLRLKMRFGRQKCAIVRMYIVHATNHSQSVLRVPRVGQRLLGPYMH